MLLPELSSWSFAQKHVGPLFLEMSEWAPGDIAMADGSRPGHPIHSGKSMLQPAAVEQQQQLLPLLLFGAGAEVDCCQLAPPDIKLGEALIKRRMAMFWRMKSCDCTDVPV